MNNYCYDNETDVTKHYELLILYLCINDCIEQKVYLTLDSSVLRASYLLPEITLVPVK